ncbi:MAG: tetratricopeptide repeat protein, partial [Porticoccaceae bacterium]
MPPNATTTVRIAAQLPLLILVAILSAPGNCSDFEALLLKQIKSGGNAQGYQWLQSREDVYANNADYYDWLSRLAMDQGDYRNAIPYLETLIELQPRHMGARLDLVIALQLEGRSHEATERLRELNMLVTDLNTLPEQAHRQIVELNRLLIHNGDKTVDHQFRVLVSAGAGFDSNANRGADSKTIPVTLPGGLPFELELTPESLKTEDE